MLIDTHAHITDARYNGAKDIISSLKDDNLLAVVTVGYDLASSTAAYKLAKENQSVYFACGIHPNDTHSVQSNTYEEILCMSRHPKCVAIGEIGLDYHYENTNKAVQERELLRQFQLVRDADLPVIIHLRDAYGDMQTLIKNNLDLLPKRGVMHCFSGSAHEARFYLDMGFYISFAGPITFKNYKKEDVIRAVPKDRLLVETDCPYLTPEPFRGRLNYPAYVGYVVQKIASVWGVSVQEAASITTQNALKLFDKIRL